VGPNRKPILKVSGEDNRDEIEGLLHAALIHYKNLNKADLPLELEKDK